MQKNLSFMSNKKQNEELQSRREFFKKAAKAALPVVGAVVLSSIPFVKTEAAPVGCTYSACTGSCTGSCSGSCASGCLGGCSANACRTNCTYSCSGGCERGSF